MTKKLKLVFSDDSDLIINLNNSITADKLATMSKHLQRVPLSFANYDNPLYYTLPIAVKQLIENARLLNIVIDQTQLTDQSYLNSLHKLYEQGYNGTAIWLEFHESIHMLENINSGKIPCIVNIGYREACGPLDKKYSYEELLTCQTSFKAGDCFVSFSELGKTPYTYWKNNELNDINRLVQLAKPIIRLNFKILIALTDFDNSLSGQEQSEFNAWFAPYKHEWCEYWAIPDWSITQILGGIKIGETDKVDMLVDKLRNNKIPTKLIQIND